MYVCVPADAAADLTRHVGGPRVAGGTRRVAEADALLPDEGGTGPPVDSVGPAGVQEAARQCQTRWFVSSRLFSFNFSSNFCFLHIFLIPWGSFRV